MDLQLDPQTLLQLEQDGFVVTTKQLRTGNIFYQNELELEQYKPSSLATPSRIGSIKKYRKNGEKNLTIKSLKTQPKPSQNKRNSKMAAKQLETTSLQTRERSKRYSTRSQMMDETSSNRTQSQIKNGYYKSEISDRKVVILAKNKMERGKMISKRAFDKVSYTTKDSEYGLESITSNFRNLKYNHDKYQRNSKKQRINSSRDQSSLYFNNNISSLTSANRNHSKQTSEALCKIKLGFFDNLLLNINPEKNQKIDLDDQQFQKPDPILRPILKKKQTPCSHHLPAETAETLEMNEIQNKAQTFIDEMNATNLKNLQQSKNHNNYKNGAQSFEVIQLQNQRSKIIKKFKVYQEDQLKWPIESILIKESHMIRPKNGENKRISQEQDYDSDKDIVNSAKQKLKREVKDAILEQIGEKQDSM